MGVGNVEPTRVFDAAGQPGDKTLAVSAPVGNTTRMGVTTPCPVCGTSNSDIETYCAECGFALATAPGEAIPVSELEQVGFALVESGTGRRIPLKPGVNAVGREGADVLLMDPTVSRRHAEIEVSQTGVVVTDLGSTNGTQVDGVPLQSSAPAAAAPGAMLRFGNATFVLAGPSDAAAATEPTMALNTAPTSHEDAAPEEEAVDVSVRLIAANAAASDILLKTQVTSVGRRSNNAHVITGDPYVSGAHAEFTLDGEDVYVTDLDSTNGTAVNGQRLRPQERFQLRNGDEVQIGQGRYVLRMGHGEDAPVVDDAGLDAAPENTDTELSDPTE